MSEQAQEATADAQAADATNTATSTTASTADSTTQRVETFTREDVEKLRREAAAYRKRATEAEAKVKEADDAKLSELELAKKQAAEAEQRAQEHEAALKSERLRGTIERTAARLGFADVDVAEALINKGAIEYGDDGAPTNVETLLTKLLADKPYLKRAVQSGATTNAATRNQGGPERTDADIRAEVFGTGVHPFDHRRVAQRGGGAMPLRPKGSATGSA